MDPRLKLAMIMLFFQAVQLQNKAVQLVMLELESTPGKGEKQTARNGRNGKVFPVFIRCIESTGEKARGRGANPKQVARAGGKKLYNDQAVIVRKGQEIVITKKRYNWRYEP